jgi:hypothetical protein
MTDKKFYQSKWIIVPICLLIVGFAYVFTPREYTLKVESDNNTRIMVHEVTNATYTFSKSQIDDINLSFQLSLCEDKLEKLQSDIKKEWEEE